MRTWTARLMAVGAVGDSKTAEDESCNGHLLIRAANPRPDPNRVPDLQARVCDYWTRNDDDVNRGH